MSDWSDNPNAPEISHDQYLKEKAYFAGILIGLILYGIIVVLFFQCMVALFGPAQRRRGSIRWGLVSYTMLMFSVETVLTGIQLHIQSISFIDNREYPGVEGVHPPGPLGYQEFIRPEALSIVSNLMFYLNNWLADGLLLYRCCVIYSTNLWIIAFPCLVFLASMLMGIMTLVTQAGVSGGWIPTTVNFGLPYFAISISLNVLLTLMIVIRLVLHSRNIRAAMGPSSGIGELYKTIVTMLIESCALYALTSLLVIGLSGSWLSDLFMPIHASNQVVAPLLIIRRVANQSALTGSTVSVGPIGSFRVRSRGGSTGGSSTLPDGGATSSVDGYEMNPDKPGVVIVAKTTADPHQDSKVY